jgi:hypothetical protein
MDVGKLLEKVIAQNEIIIRQNEKMLLLLAARVGKNDAKLADKISELTRRIDKQSNKG